MERYTHILTPYTINAVLQVVLTVNNDLCDELRLGKTDNAGVEA